MKYRRSIIQLICLILLLVTCLPTTFACRQIAYVEIENQSGQLLTIYVNGRRCSDVPAGGTVKVEVDTHYYFRNFIEGVNAQEQIIYSRIYGISYLEEADWKLVILPSEENPYLPLEIENTTDYFLYIYVDGLPIGRVESGASMKKRPLPPENDRYTIEALFDKYTDDDLLTTGTAYDQVWMKSALENMDWKIVIPPVEGD
jgi:hypothetical protein